MYSFGFILIFPLLTEKWFCGCFWVSPATSSSSFDFGCDCDGYFPALRLKHQQYCSIFLPQGFPQSQGSWSCPDLGVGWSVLLQLGLGGAADEYNSLSLFEGMIRVVKNLPAMWDTRVQSLSRKDPLEKKMATHSSILAWRVPWTEKMAGLQSMGSQRVRHDWETNVFTFFFFWGDTYTVLRGPWGLVPPLFTALARSLKYIPLFFSLSLSQSSYSLILASLIPSQVNSPPSRSLSQAMLYEKLNQDAFIGNVLFC